MQVQAHNSNVIPATQTRMIIHSWIWVMFVGSLLLLVGTAFTTTLNESTPPPSLSISLPSA